MTTSCLKTIANILNRHFTSVGEKLASKLENSKTKFESYLNDKCQNNIFLHEIEMHEILDEIQGINIKKAMGYDDIPPKIIKWCPEIFAPILRIVFNKCLEKGTYPDLLI